MILCERGQLPRNLLSDKTSRARRIDLCTCRCYGRKNPKLVNRAPLAREHFGAARREVLGSERGAYGTISIEAGSVRPLPCWAGRRALNSPISPKATRTQRLERSSRMHGLRLSRVKTRIARIVGGEMAKIRKATPAENRKLDKATVAATVINANLAALMRITLASKN